MPKKELKGIIFDVREMALHDGPGIRTVVFLKGCPLRCVWCHNPEGLEPERQIMAATGGCTDCGSCRAACIQGLDRDSCTLCGACITACNKRLRKICGKEYTSDALAKLIMKNKDYFSKQGGGVTFSGGEPTMQAEFLIVVLKKLDGMHRAIETCGHCAANIFTCVIEQTELVLFDFKIADSEKHRKYTGASNELILANLEALKRTGQQFIVRIPLIPGFNDDSANMRATAKLLQNTPSLQRVELLPYHRTAGSKYTSVGLEYRPPFDTQQSVKIMPEIFEEYGISCHTL